jgi:hypothetical protein
LVLKRNAAEDSQFLLYDAILVGSQRLFRVWRWRLKAPLKCHWLYTSSLGAISQKTWIFINASVRTSNLAEIFLCLLGLCLVVWPIESHLLANELFWHHTFSPTFWIWNSSTLWWLVLCLHLWGPTLTVQIW